MHDCKVKHHLASSRLYERETQKIERGEAMWKCEIKMCNNPIRNVFLPKEQCFKEIRD